MPWAIIATNTLAALRFAEVLDYALSEHSLGDLHEASDIGAFDVVDVIAFLAVLDTLLVDARHNLMQTPVPDKCPECGEKMVETNKVMFAD